MEKVNVPLQINRPSSTIVNVPSEEPLPPTPIGSVSISSEKCEPVPSEDSFLLIVPPTTPASRFLFSHSIETLRRPFPKLDTLKIPYVREIGVKASIDILSKFFSCPNYKLNAIQFWFLDVIADCLWKLQDEFCFPERYQKIIIEWILYIVDLIRDPLKNLSRKEFFQIFNEALVIADEKIQAGCEMVPSPDATLFTFEEKEIEAVSFYDSLESSSVVSESSGESYVAREVDDDVEVFQLPKREEECNRNITPTRHPETRGEDIEEEVGEILCLCEDSSVEFYQPDLGTPSRFRSLSEFSISSDDDDLSTIPETRFEWKPSFPAEKLESKCSDREITSETQSTSETTLQTINNNRAEWDNYLNNRKEMIETVEQNILINSCALSAIKDFVYDYFYESFQYTIVRLALMNQFNSITQQINTKWKVPKVLKEELKRPKEKKGKKNKKKKGKKKKGKKPRKKTKAKKGKKKKPKKVGKKKKPKKPKKHKLTKEEKEELARLRREQERLEEEQRIALENKILLFPLKEATDDDFFKSIFDRWVRPKEKGKKGGKGKKGKKMKK